MIARSRSRPLTRITLALLVAVVGSACSRQSQPASAERVTAYSTTAAENPAACIETFDPQTDYFPAKVSVQHARLFTIDYHGHYKVLRITFRGFADNPRFTTSEMYVLVQCGTPTPDLRGDLLGAHVVQIPAQSVTTTTNEDLGMIEALGLLPRLKSVGTRAVYPQEIWDAVRDGRLPVTGGWGAEGPQLELLASLAPDVVVLGAFHSAVSSNMQRVRDIGLATVPSLNRVEATPLGRAEWLKALATLFNKELEANALYSSVAARYQALARRARTATTKPTAFWGTTYAAGEWSVQRNSWQARLMEDAGAQNVLADDGPPYGVPVSAEVVVAEAGEAGFWITENDYENIGEANALPGTRLAELRSRRLKQVYYVCGRLRAENDGCDYYHAGPARPDMLLEDLVTVFHPDVLPARQTFFLINPTTRGWTP
jgi:iron complex transport system substrate-binding protein